MFLLALLMLALHGASPVQATEAPPAFENLSRQLGDGNITIVDDNTPEIHDPNYVHHGAGEVEACPGIKRSAFLRGMGCCDYNFALKKCMDADGGARARALRQDYRRGQGRARSLGAPNTRLAIVGEGSDSSEVSSTATEVATTNAEESSTKIFGVKGLSYLNGFLSIPSHVLLDPLHLLCSFLKNIS